MKTKLEEIEESVDLFDRWADDYLKNPPTPWEAANNRMVKYCSKRATNKRKAVERERQKQKELRIQERRN